MVMCVCFLFAVTKYLRSHMKEEGLTGTMASEHLVSACLAPCSLVVHTPDFYLLPFLPEFFSGRQGFPSVTFKVVQNGLETLSKFHWALLAFKESVPLVHFSLRKHSQYLNWTCATVLLLEHYDSWFCVLFVCMFFSLIFFFCSLFVFGLDGLFLALLWFCLFIF